MREKWYPGHMVRARRTVQENLQNVDVVIEVRDARVPDSSGNPDLDDIVRGKPIVMVLNKRDLADPKVTESWIQFYQDQGKAVIAINALKGQGTKEMISLLKKAVQDRFSKMDARGRRERAIRVMIVGIPNVGKSQLINHLAQRGAARTGDRPGVTRGKQWIHIDDRFLLLDTPGILWPRQKDDDVQLKLDLIAALDSKTGDPETVILDFFNLVGGRILEHIGAFFNLEEVPREPLQLLEAIGKARGMLISGGQIDLEKTAVHILRALQTGKLGRISFEEPSSVGDDSAEHQLGDDGDDCDS